MENDSGQFKRLIMSFSYRERRRKDLLKYRRRISELKNMDADEIAFEYITLKCRYDRGKSVFSIFLISIVLGILINVWGGFFDFINKATGYASSIAGSEVEIATVSFMIAIIIAVFVTLLVLVILGMYMKELHRIHRELMIVEFEREGKICQMMNQKEA